MKNLRNHGIDHETSGEKNVVDPCGEFTEKIYMQLAGACTKLIGVSHVNVPVNDFCELDKKLDVNTLIPHRIHVWYIC